MGGQGSGGARVHSGPPPQGKAADRLHGARGVRGVVAAVPPADVSKPKLADELSPLWDELAPLAVKELTLTPATSRAFVELLGAIHRRDELAKRLDADGWTYVKVTIDGSGQEHSELKKHPLFSEHRAWNDKVRAGLKEFRLAAMGRPIVQEQKAADPFDEFLGPLAPQ